MTGKWFLVRNIYGIVCYSRVDMVAHTNNCLHFKRAHILWTFFFFFFISIRLFSNTIRGHKLRESSIKQKKSCIPIILLIFFKEK